MANSGEQCSVVAKIVRDDDDDYDVDDDFNDDDFQSDEVRIVSASASRKVVIPMTKGATSAMEMMKHLYLQWIHQQICDQICENPP